MVAEKADHVQTLTSGLRKLVAVALAALVIAAPSGCGKSKDETAKEEAVGKQTNEQAMNRMIQEQAGRQGAQGAQGGGGR